MLDREVLDGLLGELAQERPVFHSEADFQHSLAWLMQLAEPERRIRLEYRAPVDVPMHVDVLVIEPSGQRMALELKYWTRRLQVSVKGEAFSLRHQSAHDTSRYDFIKDISRVERLIEDGLVDTGWVIAVTNDSAYWRPATRDDTIDAAFRLDPARVLAGRLAWAAHAAPGTTHGRDEPHELSGRYELSWKDYSRVADGPAGQFRYLAVPIGRAGPARHNEGRRPVPADGDPPTLSHPGALMAKYSPLQAHLRAHSGPSVQMSFSEIDQLVGGLPASARNHSAWWANEEGGRHVQARAWMEVGWRVGDVNLTAERVHFAKV